MKFLTNAVTSGQLSITFAISNSNLESPTMRLNTDFLGAILSSLCSTANGFVGVVAFPTSIIQNLGSSLYSLVTGQKGGSPSEAGAAFKNILINIFNKNKAKSTEDLIHMQIGLIKLILSYTSLNSPSGMDVNTAYRTHTLGTLLQGIIGFIIVFTGYSIWRFL